MKLVDTYDVVPFSYIWTMDGKEQRLNDEIKKGIRKMYIIMDNTLSVGGISVVFTTMDERTIINERVYLSYFVIKSEYRNKGIGTQTLHQILHQLKHENYKEVTIQVDKDNSDTYRLYQRIGFTNVLRETDGRLFLLKRL